MNILYKISLIVSLLFIPISYAVDSYAYPIKDINIICMDEVNSDTDFNTKLLARYINRDYGVNVSVTNNVQNKDSIINLPKDGYNLIVANTAHLITGKILNLNEFPLDKFDIVGVFGRQSGENIIVSKSSQIKNMDDFFNACRHKSTNNSDDAGTNNDSQTGQSRNIQQLKFAVTMGTTSDLISILLMMKRGCDFKIMNATLEGRLNAVINDYVDATLLPYSIIKKYITDQNQIKNISTIRSGCLAHEPFIPTLKESGLPDVSIDSLYVIYVPRGTNREIIKNINDLIVKVSHQRDYAEEYAKIITKPLMYCQSKVLK